MGFLFLVGSAFGESSSRTAGTPKYENNLSYQVIGASIVVISMLVLSAMGQYTYSSLLSGRLEALLSAPIRVSTVLVITTIPMMIFGIILFVSTAAPAIYLALYRHGVAAIVASIAIMSLGMIPLFALGLLLSLAVAKIGSPIILNLVQAVIFSFSGALYPLTILPEILRIIPLSLPTYYIAESLRSLASSDIGFLPLGVPQLLMITIAYGSIGSILYRRFSRALRGGLYA
jgi:ABC-type multidrug transport system permease subunit